MLRSSSSPGSTGTAFTWESAHADILSVVESGPASRDPGDSTRIGGYASLSLPDRSVAENRTVRCPIVFPGEARDGEVFDRACVVFHGLNERSWDKYWEWARAIADKSRCATVLFPIAFHMDRSPPSWANFGMMRGVSKARIARYPGLRQSSMVNAAISERLDENPGRFYISGLMAARDLGDLIASIRSGKVAGIGPEARLGFFGYSIGAFFLQCLCLAERRFADSGRRFLFCGGPHLSAMTPVSKYIIDSRAHERILEFWADLGAQLRRDEKLAALVDSPEGRAYCAMADPRHPQANRRSVFSDGATRVAGLASDTVMPMAAVLDFFRGTDVEPTIFDLPSACTHVAPFDALGGEAADDAFERLFDAVAEHLFA